MFKSKKNQIDDLANVPYGSMKEIWVTLKRNKRAMAGLIFIIVMVLLAIFADFVAPYGMNQQNLSNALQFPNGTHIMGTDDLGRDVFSRIIYGTRISLTIGVSAVMFALTIGGMMGLLAGYFKGWVDTIIMRVCDILLSIPSILLAIAIVASWGSSLTNLIVAIGIASIPIFARIIRSGVLSVSEKHFRIIFKHILPNIISPIIVQSSLGIATAILSAAGLGFIGLGVEASVAEWGTMLNFGRGYIRTHAYLTIFPGLSIMLTILSFNLLGDGIRDAVDPKMRER